MAQLKGVNYQAGIALLLEACVELDRQVNDALPDFLYAKIKAAAGD